MRTRLSLSLLAELVQQSNAQAADLLQTQLDPLTLRLEDKIRQLRNPDQLVTSYAGSIASPPLAVSIMAPDRPWTGRQFPRHEMPGMITDEEIQYYHWVSQYYSGEHAVVELGPWLGLSTVHLATALGPTLRQHGKRLHVFDDFVWRPSWMNGHMRPQDPRCPGEHESFEHLFRQYTAPVESLMAVERVKITDYDGNESLPQLRWSGGPIELLIVDCGRTIAANQAWMDIFSPHFIPHRTLVVMQDWRVHRERPRKPINQTWHFTGMNDRLRLVHEVIDGQIATFLYT